MKKYILELYISNRIHLQGNNVELKDEITFILKHDSYDKFNQIYMTKIT